jgi:hypothetical protein
MDRLDEGTIATVFNQSWYYSVIDWRVMNALFGGLTVVLGRLPWCCEPRTWKHANYYELIDRSN